MNKVRYKSATKKKWLTFIFGFCLSTLITLFVAAPFAATMPVVRMKFVDAEDHQSVAGANVLFSATANQGTLSGHGGAHVHLFFEEAVSNDSGEIVFPAQNFWPYPFIFNTNFDNATMAVFKSGYELVILSNYRRILARLEDVTTWMYNDQTIKMKRSSTDKEIYRAVSGAASSAASYGFSRQCLWKRIPRFLVTVDGAANEWNRKQPSIADEDLRRRTASSPLEHLLRNHKYVIEEDGCGSPWRFFDSYCSKLTDMFGDAGKGSVIDSETGKPFDHYVVIGVTWKLRPMDDQIGQKHATKFLIDQGTARPESFSISAWGYPSPILPPGWELDRSEIPVLRVYDSEAKYHHLSDVLWPENGQVLKMRRLSDTPKAKAEELKLWRTELDDAFKIVSDTENLQGQASEGELLKAFQHNCKNLPADLQQGLCYEPGSRQVQLLQVINAISGKSYTYPERAEKAAACTTSHTALQGAPSSARP
jgi:hypothetical protein